MKRTLHIIRIGVISAAFRGLITGAAIGFMLGVIGAFWWALLASTLTIASGVDLTGAGYVMLVLLPVGGMIVCGGLGMGIVFLATLIYNLAAGMFGGVPVDVVEDEPSTLLSVSDMSATTDAGLPSPDADLPSDGIT